jgi:hypothetical protein
MNDSRVDTYIAQQETEAQRSIEQLPTLKQEYERFLLLQLFDFHSLLYQQETMVRIFAEFFYHSHSSLKQLHDRALMDLRQQVIDVAEKWQRRIQSLSYEELHKEEFLERVKRSAGYFAKTLDNILAKPLQLTAQVETNNKQATRRLSTALPDEKQTWMACRYLLTKIEEQGFTVSHYLKEKQMSVLDALNENTLKNKRKQKAKQEPKPKTWEISYQYYQKGMKPDLIAHERGLTLGTIVGHLARYVETGGVDFNDLVSQEHQQVIENVIQKIGTNNGTTAIKNLCPPDVTYDEIHLILSHKHA